MTNEQPAESVTLSIGNDDDGNDSLEPFYEELLSLSFPDSVTAIDHCRHLCAQYGFTVKREASTHRNIYVYCSREGKPDSVRNPKGSPKRKRPSKRCDCRWCIVLFERDGQWEFRKSLNPEAARHNHPLMRPEEIESNWSQDMIDFIYQLARTQLSTADIRTRVQARYPHVAWKERRFYNRLSEERQRFRQHEATTRTRHLTSLWSKVCMAAAGNDELASYVETQLGELLQNTCQMARIDPTMLHDAIIQGESHPQDTAPMDNPMTSTQQQEIGSNSSSSGVSLPRQRSTSSHQPSATTKDEELTTNVPRGFIRVTIPQQTYFVKVHNHRATHDIQMSINKRSTSFSVADPPRKMSKASIIPAVSRDTPSVLTHNTASSSPTPPPSFIYPLTPHMPTTAGTYQLQSFPTHSYIPQQPLHVTTFFDHHTHPTYHRAGASPHQQQQQPSLPPPPPPLPQQQHPPSSTMTTDTILMQHQASLIHHTATPPSIVHHPTGNDPRDTTGGAYVMFADTTTTTTRATPPDASLLMRQQQQQHGLYDTSNQTSPSTPMPHPPHPPSDHHHHHHHIQP